MDRETRWKNRSLTKKINVDHFVYVSPKKSENEFYVTSDESSDGVAQRKTVPKRKILAMRKRGRKSLSTDSESEQEEEEQKENRKVSIKKRAGSDSKKTKIQRRSARINKRSPKFTPVSEPPAKKSTKKCKKLVKETDPAIDPSTISLNQMSLEKLPEKPKKKRAPKAPKKVEKQVAIQTSPLRIQNDDYEELDVYFPPGYDEAAYRFDEVLMEVEQNHLLENNNDYFPDIGDDLINYINSPDQFDDDDLNNLIWDL